MDEIRLTPHEGDCNFDGPHGSCTACEPSAPSAPAMHPKCGHPLGEGEGCIEPGCDEEDGILWAQRVEAEKAAATARAAKQTGRGNGRGKRRRAGESQTEIVIREDGPPPVFEGPRVEAIIGRDVRPADEWMGTPAGTLAPSEVPPDYPRRHEQTPAGDLVRDLIPAELAARMGDVEFWQQRDAEVRAQREREAAAELERWRDARLPILVTTGFFPRHHVEVALRGEIIPTQSFLALESWRGGGARALAGGVGVGKTLAAVWWMAHHGGSSPLFQRAAGLEAVGRYDRKLRARWCEASALVIDDLGMEYADGKGNLLALLDEIVDLYNADQRPLIVTTNLSGDQFKARYGERIASRIRQGGWMAVGGHDRRSVP